MELLLLGTFVPRSKSDTKPLLPGTFVPWNYHSTYFLVIYLWCRYSGKSNCDVMCILYLCVVCAAVCIINDVLRDWFTVWVIIIRLQCTPTTRHTDFSLRISLHICFRHSHTAILQWARIEAAGIEKGVTPAPHHHGHWSPARSSEPGQTMVLGRHVLRCSCVLDKWQCVLLHLYKLQVILFYN